MGKHLTIGLIGAALLLLCAVAIQVLAQGNQLLTAYSMVSKLGGDGANVTVLVDELNKAIALYQRGYVQNATSIAGQVIAEANAMASTFYFYKSLNLALTLVAVAALAALAIFAYMRRKELVGELWLRLRGDYRVRLGSGRGRVVFLDEETLSVVAAMVAIAVVFGVAYMIVESPHEPFSAIAVLNSHGRIGSYPTSIAVGQPIELYLFIYNHMGEPIWYVVRVYVANGTMQLPLNSTPIITYQRILLNNESYTFPLTISINTTGRYGIVAELWYYDPRNLTLVYTGNYVQLLLNVTRVIGDG